MADTLAMLLETFGVVVRTAYSGFEALRLISELKPHLAFIDIGMPGMDGYETARCIRRLADGRNVVLAALSGWGRSEDRKRAAEAGFDRHYVKPIGVADIEEILTLGDKKQRRPTHAHSQPLVAGSLLLNRSKGDAARGMIHVN